MYTIIMSLIGNRLRQFQFAVPIVTVEFEILQFDITGQLGKSSQILFYFCLMKL